MKKYVFSFLLAASVITPAFALGFFDSMTCKPVVLHAANNRTVLVDRLSGEVKYALKYDGQWAAVQGDQKKKYQAMYDFQVDRKRP